MVLQLLESNKKLYLVLITFVYIFLSLFVFTSWTLSTEADTAMNGFWKAKVPDVIYGKAHKPFVYRQFVPVSVRVMKAITPEILAGTLEKITINAIPGFNKIVTKMNWERSFILEYIYALLIIYGCLVCFLFALRRLFISLYRANFLINDFIPLIALLTLPVFFKQGTHFLYDIPALFFFTLLLLLLYCRQWKAFYLFFIIATVNKETTILIPLIFFFYYKNKVPVPDLLRHLAAQAGIFILIKVILSLLYTDNPGSFIEIHLYQNIRKYLVPYDIITFSGMLFLLMALFHRFSEKHEFLRRSSIIMIPLICLYLLMGVKGEMRVFLEAFPVLFLLGFHSLAYLMQWKIKIQE